MHKYWLSVMYDLPVTSRFYIFQGVIDTATENNCERCWENPQNIVLADQSEVFLLK